MKIKIKEFKNEIKKSLYKKALSEAIFITRFSLNENKTISSCLEENFVKVLYKEGLINSNQLGKALNEGVLDFLRKNAKKLAMPLAFVSALSALAPSSAEAGEKGRGKQQISKTEDVKEDIGKMFQLMSQDFQKLPKTINLPYGERGTSGASARRSFYGELSDLTKKLEQNGVSDELSSIWAKFYKEKGIQRGERVYELKKKFAQKFINNFKEEVKQELSPSKALKTYSSKEEKIVIPAMNMQHLQHKLMRKFKLSEDEALNLMKKWKSVGINPNKTGRLDQRLFSGPSV